MSQGDYRDLLAEVDEALTDQPKTFRQSMRELANAKPGTQEDKVRKTLGWGLILIGLFGVTALFFVIVLIAAVIGLIF